MKLNTTTFAHLLKAKGLTQKEVARKIEVTEKTVGRMKKGLDVHRGTAQKVADLFGVTLAALEAPPSELPAEISQQVEFQAGLDNESRLPFGMGQLDCLQLELAALRYDVSEQVILRYAPLLFTIFAELSFNERRARLEKWIDAIENADVDRPAHTQRGASLLEDALEAAQEERKSIEARDLSGHRLSASIDEADLFVQFLEKVAPVDLARTGAASIQGYQAEIRELVADTLREHVLPAWDGDLPDLPNLNETEARHRLRVAEAVIRFGYVRVSEIPTALRGGEMTWDRVRWLYEKWPADEEFPWDHAGDGNGNNEGP